MVMDFNAQKAKELTKTVKETNRILKNVGKHNSLWSPIIRSIQNGHNTVVMTIANEKVNFVNELKELGYKVTIDERRFYTEVIISW